MWVQELGFLETAAQASLPEKDSYPANTTQHGIVVTGVSSDIILIGSFIFAFTIP
jgi:hypothetical protein